jgi:hypothetical protein
MGKVLDKGTGGSFQEVPEEVKMAFLEHAALVLGVLEE